VLGDVMLGQRVAVALGCSARGAVWSAEAPRHRCARQVMLLPGFTGAVGALRAINVSAASPANNHALNSCGRAPAACRSSRVSWSAYSPCSAALWREPPMWMSENGAVRIARRCPTAPPG
jgi:hypothetical protein